MHKDNKEFHVWGGNKTCTLGLLDNCVTDIGGLSGLTMLDNERIKLMVPADAIWRNQHPNAKHFLALPFLPPEIAISRRHHVFKLSR